MSDHLPPLPLQFRPVALFITGPSGCGKTTLAREWVREQVRFGRPWTLLDKDVAGGLHGPRLLKELGADPDDRDSPVYKREVRDLDYGTTLNLAAEQLALGGSVVLPGPWTRELVDGSLFDPVRLGLPEVRSVVVWLALPEAARRSRIAQRQHAQDGWKLQNWATYANGAGAQPPACQGPEPHVLDAQQPVASLLGQLRSVLEPKRTSS